MITTKDSKRCSQRHTGKSMTWAPGQMILLGILIGAIFTNIIQYPAIDYHIASVNYPSLKGYVSKDLVEISRSYSGSYTRDRFSPYLELSKIAPGVNVIVPVNSTFLNEKLYGLGLVNNVERLNYDPEIVWADFDPAVYKIVILGGSKRRGPGKTAIVLVSGEPETLFVIKQEDTWYLVDTVIIPDEIRKEFIK